MGQNQSISRIRTVTTTSFLWIAVSAMSLLLLASAVYGQDAAPAEPGKATEPAEFPLVEPQTLLAPVKLVPVDEAAPQTDVSPAAASSTAPDSVVTSQVAPVSAPPIRLAPEPLPLQTDKVKQITNNVEGIRPASFKEITPGESTRSDIIEKLGEPLETTVSDGKEELVFKLGPFPSVQITLNDKIVSSIVIHLAAPTEREGVIEELNLDKFEPVTIRDRENRTLGEVYPERGLMFAFQGETTAGSEPKVAQVVLERISVEPFLLRVEQTPEDQITKRLENLHIVQQLLPDDAEAYAISARLDQDCGRLAAALEAAQKAVAIDAEQIDYRILLADVNRQLGHHKEAMQAIRAILADTAGLSSDDNSSFKEAKARFILGRLLAATPNHDYKQAMEETVSAIKLAASETKTERPLARRAARQLLIHAELSLAEILSYGPWAQRHTVVPKWLASAEKAANELIEQDGASRDILLNLYSTSLHCLLVLDGQGSPTNIADAAIHLGRELIAESEDLDFQTLVEWKLGTGLWYAAQIEQQQGNADEALRLANNAEALLSAAGELRPDSPETVHHLAQLHFLMGSIYAIDKKDNATAMRWYDKAMPQLIDRYPDRLLDDRGLVGEQLVSVGISLWETDRRNKAVSVTEEGAGMIDDAVKAGTFKRTALAVPYQNLSAMHREMGNDTEAKKMARKAAEYEPASASPKKRR